MSPLHTHRILDQILCFDFDEPRSMDRIVFTRAGEGILLILTSCNGQITLNRFLDGKTGSCVKLIQRLHYRIRS